MTPVRECARQKREGIRYGWIYNCHVKKESRETPGASGKKAGDNGKECDGNKEDHGRRIGEKRSE